MDLVGGHASPALLRQPREHRRLAARTRAQVKPALIRSPIQGRVCGDERGELRTLILGARAAVANRGKSRRITRFEQHSARGDGTEGHARIEDILRLVGEFVHTHQARARDECHGGHLVVRCEDVLKLVL